MDWVFTQDGRIVVRIGATGIDGLKGVVTTSMQDDTAAADTAYGTLVAPNLVAPNHDHFFSFRLDMDVDGSENSFEKGVFEQVLLDEGPRRSVWTINPIIAQTESEAMMNYNPASPVMWRVINPNVEGPLGHAPGYVIRPEDSIAYSLLALDDYPQQRAGFTNHHVWVTPYDPDELYAAGVYVNQSQGGDGLPTWTSADRSIENGDIVVWYTAGFHHAPRVEDYPIMPTSFSQFELRPYNFFDRNPALDLHTNWADAE